MDTLQINPTGVDLDAMIERGVLFHGHRGPFLVAGIRMGLLALDLLGSSGYFGLAAVSEAGRKPPISCLSDGIQIGSGCTIGKGNLEVTEVGVPLARFRTDDGRSVTIELRPAVAEAFRRGNSEEETRRVRLMPAEEMFVWRNP